jgi:hypothetical protein
MYFYQVHDADNSLFGRFTPRNFEQCLLLFVDEAVWGGSKAQAGKLKKLITEPTHEIEHKHGARFPIPSYLNLIFASNERWVVPVGYKARRFVCLDCDNRHAGSNTGEYFKPVRGVSVEAFASYLHQLDISEFNPRKVPTTDMLRDQKRRRFDSVAAWWDDFLRDGKIESFPREWQWGEAIPNQKLWDIYEAHRGSARGVARPCDLIRELRTLCTFRNAKSTQRRISGTRQYVTLLPTLEEARKDFCNKLDDPQWFDDELEEDEEDVDKENVQPAENK